jgi:hypothetical protein
LIQGGRKKKDKMGRRARGDRNIEEDLEVN